MNQIAMYEFIYDYIFQSVKYNNFLVRGRALACQQQKSRNPIGFHLFWKMSAIWKMLKSLNFYH